jgi:hypothetical protein
MQVWIQNILTDHLKENKLNGEIDYYVPHLGCSNDSLTISPYIESVISPHYLFVII